MNKIWMVKTLDHPGMVSLADSSESSAKVIQDPKEQAQCSLCSHHPDLVNHVVATMCCYIALSLS